MWRNITSAKLRNCLIFLLSNVNAPNGTPNLWLFPKAISAPNSPGGRSMVNARRSVAHATSAWREIFQCKFTYTVQIYFDWCIDVCFDLQIDFRAATHLYKMLHFLVKHRRTLIELLNYSHLKILISFITFMLIAINAHVYCETESVYFSCMSAGWADQRPV